MPIHLKIKMLIFIRFFYLAVNQLFTPRIYSISYTNKHIDFRKYFQTLLIFQLIGVLPVLIIFYYTNYHFYQ